MNKILILILIITMACPAYSATVKGIKGYRKSSGTYVRPHFRTSADHSKLNNFSTRNGKVKTYKGKKLRY